MVAVHVLDTTESLGAVELLGQAKRVDHMAIVAQVIEQLGIARIVDEHVPPHVDREVSVGACIEALILAILAGGHALVRVGELLQPWDLGLLLGYDELDAAAFNDNRLGRALDTVFNAGISSITTGVVLEAIKAYRLETKLLHFDTTSFSVHGVYLDLIFNEGSNIHSYLIKAFVSLRFTCASSRNEARRILPNMQRIRFINPIGI